jgi:hypothetical protein
MAVTTRASGSREEAVLELCEQRVDGPRGADALDHALGLQHPVREGVEEAANHLRILRGAETGADREPDVRIGIAEHRSQALGRVGQPQPREHEHGAPAHGGIAGPVAPLAARHEARVDRRRLDHFEPLGRGPRCTASP